jgi:hypothetical protein
MVLDESKLKKFWKFIQTHKLFSVIVGEANSIRMRPTAYINNQLGKKEPNNVKYIYNDWVSQGEPEPLRRSFFPTRIKSSSVMPVIRLPSSRGHGLTKRKKKRKPRKKKSVKKRKGKSKKKRVRRKRKSRRRS